MTLEKLSDFLGSSNQRDYLRRIYLSQKLEGEFQKVISGDYRVIVSPSRITLECQTPVLAQALRQQQRQLYAIVKREAPGIYSKSKIFFRVARG
jgi:hypothetical protein